MTDPTIANHVLDAILEQRLSADGSRTWQYAPPYVLRHAVEHAMDAGRVDELLVDPELLSCADPAGVIPGLDRAGSDRAMHATAVYRASLHRHRDADATTRRDLLALDAKRLGEETLSRDLIRRSASAWQPRWGTGSKVNPALRDSLGDLGGAVTVAVCGGAAGKRPVALVGGPDAETAVWDLNTGARIGLSSGPDRREGAGARQTAAAAPLTLDGRPYAAVVDPAGRVWLWNLTTGFSPHEPMAQEEGVTGIATAYPGGQPVLLLALENGSVAVVYVRTGERVELHSGQDRAARGIVAARTGGEWVAAAAYGDRLVAWDLRFAEPMFMAPQLSRAATCVAAWSRADGGDGDRLLVGDGERLHCWALDGRRLWSLDAPADAVAVAAVRNRQAAVVGGHDGTLRLWDLLLREPLHRPWPVGRAPITAVAVAEQGARAMAVTAVGEDNAMLWDLEMLAAVGQPAVGHTDDVIAVATTTLTTAKASIPVVLTGGDTRDAVVRTWDLAGGAAVMPVWEGHEGSVRALALATVGGMRFVLAGSDDGVRVHELETGHPFGTLWGCPLVRSLAVGRIADPGGPRAVGVVGDAFGEMTLWDVKTSERLYTQAIGEYSLSALLVVPTPRRDVLVTASHGGSLQRWDLATGGQIGDPIHVHEQRIMCLAAIEVDGEAFIVSGSPEDDRVGVTRLADGRQLPEGPFRTRGGVLSVATATLEGEPVVLAGDRLGVHMWRLADGRALPSIAMPAPVRAITVADGGELVVGTGWDVVVMEPVDERSRR